MKPLQPTDPEHLGPYRLTHRLGAGGMGLVYLARSPGGRVLVVKTILPHLLTERRHRARFAREAEAAQRVGGFHTAPVVGADLWAEQPWIASAYVPGPTLNQAVREHGPWEAEGLRRLLAGVAEGLTAIHREGLVHRDLKPGNIVLAPDGPRIIDFGLARFTWDDDLSGKGALTGTLPYMSPEQAGGEPLSPASDLFSLGTTVVFTATGTNPFRADSAPGTIRRVLHDHPSLAGVPEEFRALVAACWSKRPEDRPGAREILAEAGGGSLGGTWPPAHLRDEIARESVLPVSLTSDPVRRTASDEEDPGGTGGRDQGSPVATRDSPRGEASGSSATLSAATTPEAAPAPRPDQGPDPAAGSSADRKRRVYLLAAVTITLVLVALLTLRLLDPPPTEEEPAPGASGADFPYGPPDQADLADLPPAAEVWRDATPQSTVLPGEHEGHVNTLALSPSGTLLATGGADWTVRLWDTGAAAYLGAPIEHGEQVGHLAFSPDGATLVSSGSEAVVEVLDTESRETVTTLVGHGHHVRQPAFHPDGSLLATPSSDGSVHVWATGDWVSDRRLTEPATWYRDAEFSPDGSLLAAGGAAAGDDGSGLVRVWETEGWAVVAEWTEHTDEVLSVVFDHTGRLVAAVGTDDAVRVWDLDDPGPGQLLGEGHGGWGRSLAFHPDGDFLATVAADDTVHVWTPDGRPPDDWPSNDWPPNAWTRAQVLSGHGAPVRALSLSPDGSLLATADDDGTVLLWDTAEWALSHTLEGHTDAVHALEFGPDGTLLATAAQDRTVRLWTAG